MDGKTVAGSNIFTSPLNTVSKRILDTKSLRTMNSNAEVFDQGSSKSPKVSAFLLKKNLITKKIQVLQQMGFGSHIESNVRSVASRDIHPSSKFNIGLSDFWTGKGREKFLRNQGYEEAFKSLKKQVFTKNLAGVASYRRPNLPYIMDSNTKNRTANEKAKPTKNFCFAFPKLQKINNGIGLMMDKPNTFFRTRDSIIRKQRLAVRKSFGVSSQRANQNICFCSSLRKMNGLNKHRSVSMPEVLEINDKEKDVFIRRHTEKVIQREQTTKCICFASPEFQKIHEEIDSVIYKCEDLAMDNLKFKTMTHKISKDLKKSAESMKQSRIFSRNEKTKKSVLAD